MSTAASPSPPPAAKPKKSTWETILTLTPVMLTVLATILAGLSSGEMTRSMYYRSVAGQSQSKVGDQWAFFQAKRTRGTSFELTAVLLLALSEGERVDRELLLDRAGQLKDGLEQGADDADQLKKAAAKADELGKPGKALLKAIDKLQKAAERSRVVKLCEEVLLRLNDKVIVAAFAYLGTGQMPEAAREDVKKYRKEERKEDLSDPLTAALVYLEKPTSDKDFDRLSYAVSEDALRAAIKKAEANARNFEQAADEPVEKPLGELGRAVDRFLALALAFHRAARDVQVALAALPADGKGVAEMRQAGAPLSLTGPAVKNAANDLNIDFKAAQFDFTGRRNRVEASLNRDIANVYEVQVHRNSYISDLHRERSKRFFYGMLGAQAGVAIASFALAARQRSVLWMLATLFGLGALGFSLWVYFGV